MYTYKDFEDKAKEYGFTGDQISEADYKLAKMNPDAGVALLGYKNDWLTADNDSAKAMAHAAAEDIRSRYGNYSGGASGGSYTPTGAAQYEDPWEQAIRSTMKNLENRSFEWSPQTDPTLKYYEDAYRREGQRAMKDTLGVVAATTGGIPSSYATAAAAQQNNYYAQQLTDKYPELYQQAYENFLKEYDREYQMLDAYMRLGDTDYNRWSDQQERDRNARLDRASAEQQAYENQMAEEELQFEKDTAAQEIAIENERLRIMEEELDLSIKKFDHEVQTAIKDDAYRWAALIQEGKIAEAEQEYRNSSLALEEREIAMRYAYQYAELDYNRDVLAEESRQADLDREHQLILAQIEDQLRRDQLAKDISDAELEKAIAAAEYGDLSLLEDLGADVSAYQKLLDEQLGLTEEEPPTGVVDAYVDQGNGVSDTNPFNQPQKTTPDFVETPAMVTPSTIPNQRKDKANEGKSDVQIAKEETQTANEIKEQQKPEALYERFLNGGQLTEKELETVQKKYGKEMQSAQVLYRRYQSGGILTAKEREIVEKAYGKNVFNYGDTYGIK